MQWVQTSHLPLLAALTAALFGGAGLLGALYLAVRMLIDLANSKGKILFLCGLLGILLTILWESFWAFSLVSCGLPILSREGLSSPGIREMILSALMAGIPFPGWGLLHQTGERIHHDSMRIAGKRGILIGIMAFGFGGCAGIAMLCGLIGAMSALQ